MSALKEFLLYKYYDTPEGENCFNKTFYTAKWSAVVGAVYAYYDGIANRHLVPGWTKTGFFIRGMGKIVPFAVCGAFFGASTCLFYSFRRNQQDYLPYVASAAGTGLVWGAVTRNPVQGGAAALVFAFVAWNKKHSRLNNYRYFPDPALVAKHRTTDSTLWFRDIDYSMLALSKWQPKTKTYYFPGSVEPFPQQTQQAKRQ